MFEPHGSATAEAIEALKRLFEEDFAPEAEEDEDTGLVRAAESFLDAAEMAVHRLSAAQRANLARMVGSLEDVVCEMCVGDEDEEDEDGGGIQMDGPATVPGSGCRDDQYCPACPPLAVALDVPDAVVAAFDTRLGRDRWGHVGRMGDWFLAYRPGSESKWGVRDERTMIAKAAIPGPAVKTASCADLEALSPKPSDQHYVELLKYAMRRGRGG